VHARYIEFAKRTLPRQLDLEGMRVVVDCANGAAYKVAPETLWELGAEVIPLGVEPIGFKHQPRGGLDLPGRADPQGARAACGRGIRPRRRRRPGAHRGREGPSVDGDQLMAGGRPLLAPRTAGLTQPGIVATVMSNLGLERYLERPRPHLVRTAGGRSRYVLDHMREHGYEERVQESKCGGAHRSSLVNSAERCWRGREKRRRCRRGD
jgi:phosphoglucosamine mutase